MFRVAVCALVCGLVGLTGGVVGQDAKKDEPKAVAKEEPKAKGLLPQNWGKIGLTDDQRQRVYKIQAKYGDEIEKLEAKIKQLRSTREKEMREVLTADQKRRLEEIYKSKAGSQ